MHSPIILAHTQKKKKIEEDKIKDFKKFSDVKSYFSTEKNPSKCSETELQFIYN